MRHDQVSTREGSKTVWGLSGQEAKDKKNHNNTYSQINEVGRRWEFLSNTSFNYCTSFLSNDQENDAPSSVLKK